MQFYYLKTKLKCKSCACKYVLDCKKQEKELNVKKFPCKKVETWKIHFILSKLHEKIGQKIMMQIYKSNWIEIFTWNPNLNEFPTVEIVLYDCTFSLLFYSCKWCAISILFWKINTTTTKILYNSLNNNKNSSIAWSFFAKIDDFRATKLALDKEHCESMEMKVQSEFLIASNDIIWNLFVIVMIIFEIKCGITTYKK